MKFRIMAEYITLIFITFLSFLFFLLLLIYIARFSLGWYIFSNVADTFYYRMFGVIASSIILLLVINFMLNITIFTNTYFYKSIKKLDFEVNFSPKNTLIRSVFISIFIIGGIFLSLFCFHLLNKKRYFDIVKTKITNIVKKDEKIIFSILENAEKKENPKKLFSDFQSLKLEDSSLGYSLQVLIPIKDTNGKFIFRQIKDPKPLYRDGKQVEFDKVLKDFYNLESRSFHEYIPEDNTMHEIFEEIQTKQKELTQVNDGDNFTCIFPIYNSEKSYFIILFLKNRFKENDPMYFNF
ncbi:MAG: hypothetical protein SFU98_01385 [Leptospiraceae bacterium]|nr:hypothetical protein [Leptospiraceae bacterium]